MKGRVHSNARMRAILICWIFMCWWSAIAGVQAPMPRSASISNILFQSNISTVPEAGTCGFAGTGSEFILESEFEFGDANYLFRSGQAIHCASECIRKLPRPTNSYVQVFSDGDNGTSLGLTGCLTPLAFQVPIAGDRFCYVDIKVTPSHSATYALWIKPSPQASGVILDSGTLLIHITASGLGETGELEVYVGRGRTRLAAIHVPNAASRWLHIAVQENLLLVADADLLAAAATYTVLLDGAAHAFSVDLTADEGTVDDTLRIGAPRVPTEEFPAKDVHSEFRDIRRYNVVITNREIQAILTGQFLEVRPMSECLCDEDHPRLDLARSNVHCWQNRNDVTTPSRRLDPGTEDDRTLFFLVDFAVDGLGQYNYDLPLFWLSAPGLDQVSLLMDDLPPAEITSISIQLVSAPPAVALVIERRMQAAGKWIPWHYYAFDCAALGFTSGFNGEMYMPEPYGPACQDITKLWNDEWQATFSGVIRHPPVITWTLAKGRPGHVGTWRHSNLTTFMRTQGLRITFQGAPRGSGSDSRRQVHAVAEVQALGKEVESVHYEPMCECFPGTTFSSHCGLQGECSCREDYGDRQLAGPQCAPYITKVMPEYGPISGGTNLELHGGFLGSSASPEVRVGDIPCVLRISNNSVIWCKTSSVPSVPESLQTIRVDLTIPETDGDIYQMQLTTRFNYKSDPVVTSIQPLKTFIRGGIPLTVHGFSLDSVADPKLEIKMTYRGRNYPQPLSDCTHHSTTQLLCPTPRLHLPAEYEDLDIVEMSVDLDGTQKKKRDISRKKGRNRRASDDVISYTASSGDGVISNSNLEFTPGLHLDGVDAYKNLPVYLPEYSQLLVYGNPIVHAFEENPYLFISNREDDLKIMGRHLNGGCQRDDYIITVGGEPCHMMQLHEDYLLCKPPPEQPEMTSSPDQTWEGSIVIVNIGNIRREVGFVFYQPATLWDDPAFRIGIIASLCILIIIIIIIVLVCLSVQRGWVDWGRVCRKKKEHPPGLESIPLRSLDGDHRRSLLQSLDPELQSSIQECLLDNSHLDLIKEVGKGHFGRVYAGVLRHDEDGSSPTLVAIKTLRGEAFQSEAISEFLREATIMKDFDHLNVLQLIGVVIEEHFVYVVLPFMEHGDLRTFIAKPEQMLTVRELLDFGLQAARGMAYLEQQKFVHRDVAARNCMVDSDMVVKVADFGLARDMYEKDYYRPEDMARPLPVKWTALECLDGAEFTTKSDVWSFGVLLWEILTRGRKPYNDINNFDMKRYLTMGRRLGSPEFCPTKVFDLMQSCWLAEAQKRPSFQDVVSCLDSVLHPMSAMPVQDAHRRGFTSEDEGPHSAASTPGSQRPASRLSAVPSATPDGGRDSYTDSGSASGSPLAQRAINGASGYSPAPRKTPYKSVTSPLVQDSTDKVLFPNTSPPLPKKSENQTQDTDMTLEQPIYANDPSEVSYEPQGGAASKSGGYNEMDASNV